MELEEILARIEARLKAVGISADRASKMAGKPDAIRNLRRAVKSGDRSGVSTATIAALAGPLQTTPAWLLEAIEGATVQVVGLAGAGTDGSVLFSGSDGELGEGPMPPGGNDKTVALEVRGTSMHGIAEEGWLIYYDDRRSPVESDMIGELCVLGLADGRVLIKKPFRSRDEGLFDLESTSAPTLRSQVVEWAALVTAIIPRRTARRIERSTPVSQIVRSRRADRSRKA